MPRLSRPSVALIGVFIALAAGIAPFPRTLASATTLDPLQAPTCAVGVPAPVVCDRTLGMALTVPKGWSVVPPGKLQPGPWPSGRSRWARKSHRCASSSPPSD